MRPMPWKSLVAPALGALLLAGCAADNEGLLFPETPPSGGDLFARYVAMGQSLTAGYQSDGINDSTQHEAYAVLLARQAGGPFFVPSLAGDGCPPPLVGPQPTTAERVGDGSTQCALRTTPPPPYVSNLAVPGARIVDYVDNNAPDTRSNALTLLFLGGRTQLEAMRDANPTFVSVWPDGNDVLRAVVAGVPSLATSQADFEAALDLIVDGIRAEGAAAVLLAMPDVPRFVPALQPGTYYYMLGLAGQLPPGKTVSPDCAPGTVGGSSLVSFGVLSDPSFGTISCAEDAPGVLSPPEIADVTARVAAFNAALQDRAQRNGWLYFDADTWGRSFLSDPDKIRKCQGLATATTQEAITAAVLQTCPGPNAPNFWGSYMSFDPVHMSLPFHQELADALAGAINDHYGVQIRTGS